MIKALLPRAGLPPPPECAAVLELLAGYCASPLGRAELDRLEWIETRAALEAAQSRLGEARRWLRTCGSFSFSDWEDPRPLLRRAAVPAAVLEGAELLRLSGFLEQAAALRTSVGSGAPAEASTAGWPDLAAWAAAMGDFSDLRRQLGRALGANGELEDDASPLLATLRRQRARQRQAIEASLGEHLRRLGDEGVARDSPVTVRNERYVLPVRAELRRRAPGIVHGASGTGQTLFVEPIETIELNNENIRLRDAELAEVQRILAELTAAVGVEARAIERAAELAGRLEFEAAKARFAADYGATEAVFTPSAGAGGENAAPRLDLVGARHPLLVSTLRGLSGRAVVPLDLALDRERILVISGPNAGGKSVALKTVAMAGWMAHCGLPVCAQRALLPRLRAIGADLGDAQSIAESLSTFSSHVRNLAAILAAADEDTLILLDELGTATNPAEGAALAEAVAAQLLERRVWTLISTHHDRLKTWAAATPGVANASVGVDPATLEPNYQFRLGVPGVSAGLDMAARLGLSPELVERARALLSREEREAGDAMQRLHASLADAEARAAELDRRGAELDARERALAAHDRDERARALAKLKADTDRRFAAFTAAAEVEWRRAAARLESDAAERTQSKKAAQKAALEAARLRRETTAAFEQAMGTAPPPGPVLDPSPGDQVRLRDAAKPATVLRRVGRGFEVRTGNIRLQVAAADIVAILPRAGAGSAGASISGAGVDAALTPAVELNLVGLRAEEAAERLEKFLDQAILAGTDRLRIVHGTGFGVLRKTVAEVLKAHPAVKHFAHPDHNQGGQGVTLAELA